MKNILLILLSLITFGAFGQGTSGTKLTAGNIGNYAWKLTGNSGTNDATNFIGTTDNQDLRFRVNNTNMGRLEYDSRNVAFGRQAMNAVTSGTFNVSIGNRSSLVMTTGTQNVVVGGTALTTLVSGNFNTAVGYGTDLDSDTLDATILLGHESSAGKDTAIAVGALAYSNGIKSIALGANSFVGCDYCASYGDTANDYSHGFGTAYPTEKLDVRGSIRMVDGNQGTGKVLVSDANGVGAWTNVDSTVVSSAGTLGLTSNVYNYVFSGTTTTWTLPAIAGVRAGHHFYIKNRGSGAITLNAAAAANEIYSTSAVNTLAINAGESILLVADGTFFNLE